MEQCWEGGGTVLGGGWNSVGRGVEQCWEGGGTVYQDVEAVDSRGREAGQREGGKGRGGGGGQVLEQWIEGDKGGGGGGGGEVLKQWIEGDKLQVAQTRFVHFPATYFARANIGKHAL